jgi:hypothetical protein
MMRKQGNGEMGADVEPARAHEQRDALLLQVVIHRAVEVLVGENVVKVALALRTPRSVRLVCGPLQNAVDAVLRPSPTK